MGFPGLPSNRKDGLFFGSTSVLCEALPLNKYDCQHTGLFHTHKKIADSVDLVMRRFRKVVVVVIQQRVLYFSELAKSKVPENPLTWAQSHQKSSWWSKSFIISILIRKLLTSTHPYLVQELRGSLIHWSSCGFHITG